MDSTKLKTVATIIILTAGAVLTVAMGTGTEAADKQKEGIIIDFGSMDTAWTQIDIKTMHDPISALKYACGIHGFAYDIEGKSVKSIDGRKAVEKGAQWSLYGILPEKIQWTIISADFKLSDYTVTAWALRSAGDLPTVAVDQSGRCIYGYPQVTKVVTLSPSLTEVLSFAGSMRNIVGTDKYSNYPDYIAKSQISGKVKIVGDFTTPNYESIIKTSPDAVFCDGSQYNHIQVTKKLRSVNVNAVLMYAGEGINTIRDNLFIAGIVTGHDMKVREVISEIDTAVDKLPHDPVSIKTVKTMLALSGDMSPWVSGSNTYADDVLIRVNGANVFADQSGWVHVNSEQIMKRNPSVVVITSYEMEKSKAVYDAMLSSLSQEWKSTDAYKSGEIYLICESAADLAQRPGPRYAQLAELIGRILSPDAYGEGKVPKIIGDDFRELLTITKEIDIRGDA